MQGFDFIHLFKNGKQLKQCLNKANCSINTKTYDSAKLWLKKNVDLN